MVNSMPRDMKHCGVEWIGEIPSDWTLAKYKNFSSNGMGQTILKEDLDMEGIPVYSATKSDIIFGHVKNSRIQLMKGDFVIPARGNSIGSITMVKDEIATCTQTTIYSKICGINKKYLYYCGWGLKFEWFKFDQTAIPQITVSQVNNNIVPLPNKEEQKLISAYLDKKICFVDTTIEKTKQSIEEYKKYKQSLITEVVTKGLDPNVKMKDSGIEWIGEIPEHWDVIKLKYLFEVRKRISGELGYDVLSVTQQGLKIKDIESNEGQLSANYSKYQFVYQGDYVMNHMDLLTGWVDLSKFNGVTSPDYRVFSMRDDISYSKEYYNSIFQMCYTNRIFYGMGQGVSNLGRWRLQTDKFINTPLPVPPVEEQIQIAKFVSDKLDEIRNFVSKKEILISELEAYKKSLIYEVVTGKKEVI